MIRNNGDRYCKNPYFLHSVCTSGPAKAYTEVGSLQGGQAYGDNSRTIRSKKTLSKFSQHEGPGVMQPPRLKKKIRPFSAPRHQGLRSVGLKNKVGQQNQVMQSYQRPGTTDMMASYGLYAPGG